MLVEKTISVVKSGSRIKGNRGTFIQEDIASFYVSVNDSEFLQHATIDEFNILK